MRKPFNAGTEIVDNDGPRFPPGDAYGAEKPPGVEDAKYVPGEVKAGDCTWRLLKLIDVALLLTFSNSGVDSWKLATQEREEVCVLLTAILELIIADIHTARVKRGESSIHITS